MRVKILSIFPLSKFRIELVWFKG